MSRAKRLSKSTVRLQLRLDVPNDELKHWEKTSSVRIETLYDDNDAAVGYGFWLAEITDIEVGDE